VTDPRTAASDDVLAAAHAVVDAHKRIIHAVTPNHPGWLASPEQHEAMEVAWSTWHSTCRRLRDALGRSNEYH
jgi:formylmethanofuran:tetrahydromethanopterin formyltransferase